MSAKVKQDFDLVSVKEAASLVGLSRSTFWASVAAGRMPEPFYPSPGTPRWRVRELQAALEATRCRPREAMAKRRAATLAAAGDRVA